MPAVEVRDLRKSYADVEAVRGISFEVAEGEVFAMLGPNGAGKTTTTEILEGYRARTSGEVVVLGHDPIHGKREMRERIGIVLQSSGILEELTVAETLEMYGAYYARCRPVGELVELVELDGKADKLIKTLSGGQRRRLDLALALVGDPDLVFLDEPTTGFDPSARRTAWRTIRNLCSLGKTIFLTTHYMDEAQELADRVAVIAGGEIVASGTPETLGGRDTAASSVRFLLPPDAGVTDLPEIPGGDVRVEGRHVLISTQAPVETAHRITGWAIERGAELEGFSVTPPTLEDIYLALTGHIEQEPAS
jgi:ABC-2 type transport system ATP-binding protein